MITVSVTSGSQVGDDLKQIPMPLVFLNRGFDPRSHAPAWEQGSQHVKTDYKGER